MNSQIVTVNLVPGLSTPAVVRVSQYDVGRPLTFKVLDGTGTASFDATTTATVTGTKPSGLGFTESGTIAGNTVTLNTTLAMTQERGKIPAEIRFTKTGEDIGTANFILAVEPSPHPDGTTDGTQETMANLETRLQSEINDLSDRIDDIEAGGSGLSQTEKNLILTLFSKAAYAESDAESAYDALEAMWASSTKTITYNLSHVSSSNSTASIENGQSYTTTLTATGSYTLNTVTVTMGGVDITSTAYSSGTVSIPSVTGNIVITATAVLQAQSITATYTQSGTVYDTATLDSLKADLVVTANYSGGTSETVPSSDYTLSGTLTEGTSTITVSYAGLTDTFSVTVTSSRPSNPYVTDNMTLWLDGIFNTATGHDASATTWTNLIDNEIFTGTGVTVSTDGMIFDGTQGHGFLGTKPSAPATLEIVMSATDSSVTQGVIGGYGNGAGNLNIKSNALLEKRGDYQGSPNAITMESGVHTYTFVDGAARYLDGESVSAPSVNISMTGSGDKITIGCGYGANDTLGGYPFTGTIKCIRFYSDALTAQEVASNFAIDATRFGIS